MRNHMHQFGSMSARYSPRELRKRRDKRWYRALKAGMTDEWVEVRFHEHRLFQPLNWLIQKIKAWFSAKETRT